LGYSPERINPGDRVHNLQNVCKLVSASSEAGVKLVKDLYKKICKNIHICSSIEIAESAKIIENTQRDLNIALINELQMIFEKMNINIYDVLDAAKTKWNFLNFQPGLVGGHCIGVDPYYLTYKAKKIGHKPKLILAGRYINDEMPNYFKKKILNLIKKKFNKKVNLLFMGLTFKENCNDLRNSKNLELCSLLSKDFLVDAYDPNMRMNNFKKIEKKINFINKIKKKYDVIIIALPHNNFIKMGFNNIKKLLKKNGIIFDLKNTFGKFFIS